MSTFIELTKEIFQMSIALIIVGTVAKLFLAHTLIGKIIAVTFKNVYLTLRGMIRIINYLGNKVYNIGKTTNNYLNKKNKTKQTQKKVVNGNNVVDFKSAKQLRHKWY